MRSHSPSHLNDNDWCIGEIESRDKRRPIYAKKVAVPSPSLRSIPGVWVKIFDVAWNLSSLAVARKYMYH